MTHPPDNDDLLRARSYDDVANAYETVNAPLMFDAPAQALVRFAAVAPGERVLDVGAGTGAVSRAVLAAAADVVALDPSVPMLLAARRGGVTDAVAGMLPDLPIIGASVDVVLSAFVMTHVDDPDAATRDIHRVLRRGGRLALSAWSPSDDEYSAAWSEVVSEFAPADAMEAAALRVLPGEPRFSRPTGLADLLDANGFARVRTETHSFVFELNLREMVETRGACASGRALRAMLSDAEWSAFQARVREVLGRKFPRGIRYNRRVHVSMGWKD
jgi:ubiquinone/menaquinone biosynthesis C-methylase UbiE